MCVLTIFTEAINVCFNYLQYDMPMNYIDKRLFPLQLHCCGQLKFQDWFGTPWEKLQTNKTNVVPKSCCRVDENKCKNYDLPMQFGNETLDIYTQVRSIQQCWAEIRKEQIFKTRQQ